MPRSKAYLGLLNAALQAYVTYNNRSIFRGISTQDVVIQCWKPE